MKRLIFLLLPFICTGVLFAQQPESTPNKVAVSVEARTDLQYTVINRQTLHDETGINGYILNLKIDGALSPNFAYSYRQRLNAVNRDAAFFDSVDWVYLKYMPTAHWSLTVGKTPVFVGGWELDLAPIDCFFLSSFDYHFAPYQWGANVTYTFGNSDDELQFQVCQSPFQEEYRQSSGTAATMWAYNLKWMGRHGFFKPNWSVNLLEYAPGQFINYLSLGSQFTLSPKIQMELDVMNRATPDHAYFFKDYSIMGRLAYYPTTHWELYAKGTLDVNNTTTDGDLAVTGGTKIGQVGGGIHYYPLQDKRVRLHGYCAYSFGTNTQPTAVVRDGRTVANIGVTWRFKVH
ncbi:MAG: porin [Porphyromonas sp.]|nr:porin [Porphyromonas sp.]